MNPHVATPLQSDASATQTANRVEHSRAALTAWLLGDNVQVKVGPHAGAIAGWTDRNGRPSYVYPEVTGYYLQWLAWHAACHGASDVTRRRAAAAHRWLLRWVFFANPPPTRVYFQSAMHDWRNAALFFFDLAMVLRGVASATRFGLIEADPGLVARIAGLLRRLVAEDGMFDACMRAHSDGEFPARWSTRRGAFLAKAAAGVLWAAEQFPELPTALERAAEATFIASLASMARESHNETHALLYGIEGALSRPEHAAAIAAERHMLRQLSVLLERSTRLGYVPESIAGGRVRLDVMAQALRAAAFLLPGNVGPIAQLLVRHIDPGAGIPFSPDARPRQYSAWTAMFAEQALFAAGCSPSQVLPLELRLLLV